MTGRTCDICDQDQLAADSCVASALWPATPYAADPSATRCRDCGVKPGGLHHPRCCLALCAKCGGQLLFDEHDGSFLLSGAT